MVRSYLAVAGTTAAALGLVSVMNCGGSTQSATNGSGGSGASTSHTSSTNATTTSTTGGMGGSTGSGPFMPVTPPPPPSGMTQPGPSDITIAISKLYIGDTDPDGTPDQTNGWEYFGYNIDGVNPADLSKFCKTVDNASPAMVHQEGKNGIENSFGHNILPIVLGIASDASTKINDSISAGKFTVMVDMEKLPSGNSANPVTAQLFLGSDLGMAPKFDGTDNWPVSPVLLADGMTIAGGSKVQFPTSYVTNNTWVSGSKGMVTLALSIAGYTLDLNISNAVITMNLDMAHQKVTGGVISGVLPTTELTNQIQMVAGSFDPSLCSGPTICSIISQIAQASDIMQDGTQDPSKQCDGISIGIGFDGAMVMNPSVVGPQPMPGANPCGDAGSATCP